MKNPFSTVKTILTAFAIFAIAHSVSATTNRPNILWIIAEDMGPEALSRAGTPQVWTPALDRLANEGVYYSRAYFGMVCSVSRSSFMTGMHAVSIGAQNHRTNNKKALPNGVRPLTEWLRDAGYFTANVRQLPEDFDFKGAGKTDWNFIASDKPFDSGNWKDLKSNQPFYAQINLPETHRDFKAPKRADPAKVVIPPYYPDHPVTRDDWAQYLDSATELDRKVSLILKQLEKDGLAENTVVVFFGDNGAAMVRAKQFCYEEGFHVPLMIRWPKGFPAPKDFKPGTVNDQLLDGIDLAPTMLEIAGVKKPAKMQGRNFLGVNAEPPREFVFGTRDRCDETAMKIRSVRDSRYRYIRNLTPEVPLLAPNNYKAKQYPVWNLLKELNKAGKLTPAQAALCAASQPGEELYDLQNDPHEIYNLAATETTKYQATLHRLRNELEQWIAKNDHQSANVRN